MATNVIQMPGCNQGHIWRCLFPLRIFKVIKKQDIQNGGFTKSVETSGLQWALGIGVPGSNSKVELFETHDNTSWI